MSQAEVGQAPHEPELQGLGGWLILPLFHLVFNAGFVTFMFVTSFMHGYNAEPPQVGGSGTGDAAVRTGGIVATFAEPSMLASLGVALLGLWVILYAIICLIRFFQKKKHVPKMMIGFYILLMSMTAANAAAIHFFPALVESEKDVHDAYTGVARVLVACVIWIPYFIRSERVKNTFVR